MSRLRVNKITNFNDNGPIEFSKGVILPTNKTISEENIKINTLETVSASFFSGAGFGITTFGFPGEISNSKAIAITLIS